MRPPNTRSAPTSADLDWHLARPVPQDAELVTLLLGSGAQAVYAPTTPGDLIYIPVFCWGLVKAQRDHGSSHHVVGFIIRPPQEPGDTDVVVRADAHPRFLGYQHGFDPPTEYFQALADTMILMGDGPPTNPTHREEPS